MSDHAVVFSDLHLDDWIPFARVDPETGLNSRMLDGINILQQIMDYCILNHIKTVLFLGDMFHHANHLYPDLLEQWFDIIWKMHGHEIEIYAIPGQHDHYAQDGLINTLAPFGHLMAVMDEVGSVWLNNKEKIKLVSCPYRRNINDLKASLLKAQGLVEDNKTIFMGHFLVKEILEKDGVKYDTNNVSFSDLPRGCDLYLLGDYHPHVYIPKLNLISVGASMQHTFGDKNRPQGGFLDLDLKTLKFKRIELDAPMFITVKPDEKFPDHLGPKNFYNIQVIDEKQQDRIKSRLGDEWNVAFPKVVIEEEENPAETIKVSLDMEPEAILARYVEHFGLSKKHLEKGLSYLK